MKNLSLRTFNSIFALSVILTFLVTSCNLGSSPSASSGSLRAWLDQPASGYTLPLAPYTIIAHARQDGGGVISINFMVNGVLLGSMPVNPSEELTSASFDWNPSTPGLYRIQAVAVNGAGQQALSEVSTICVSQNPNGTCGEAEEVDVNIDVNIKVGGAPNPVAIGANCNPADRIVSFEAFIPDTNGAIEIYMLGDLVSASGERLPFTILLTPGDTAGSYVGTLDLGTMYDGILAGVDGTLEFYVGLLDANKEFFKVSKHQTLTVHYCSGTTPLEGMVKIGGVPAPVFIGKCTPTTIDFEAGTDIDPGLFDHVDIAYVWFDRSDTWIGTVGVENRAEMTPGMGGGYWYHLDVNTAPTAMQSGGTIKFRAIVVSTDNVDVAFSEVAAIAINPCDVTPPQPGVTPYVPPQSQPCSTYTKNPDNCKNAGCYYWSDGTCSESPEPAAPTCSSYTGKASKCKNAGCYYWSDGTCSESPEPAPPSCDTYTNNPDGCKIAGCYYWSNGTCSDYQEPAPPPSCSSYWTQKECEANGCTWDEKQSLCSP